MVVVKITRVYAFEWLSTVPGTKSVFNNCQLLLLPLDLFSIRSTHFISWLLDLIAKSHPESTGERGCQDGLGEGRRTGV